MATITGESNTDVRTVGFLQTLSTTDDVTKHRYHGIFETAHYRRAFLNTAHPYARPAAAAAAPSHDASTHRAETTENGRPRA